jgi:hypothetical protein
MSQIKPWQEANAITIGEFIVDSRQCLKWAQAEIDELRQAIEQAGKVEPVDFDAIIENIEAISCYHHGSPSYEHCPYKIRTEAADVVRKHSICHTTLTTPASDWNKRIRDSVDSLLEQAGYAGDSSARHGLACMNFEAPTAPAQPTIRDFRTVQDHIKTVDIVGWRWVATCGSGSYQLTDYEPMRGYSYKSPVYEVPPVQAQERKPLTNEQITEVWRELRAQKEDWSDLDFARAIEAKIKEQAAPAQAGAQPTVTCQIYGHVVGACAECNTHNEVGAQPAPVPESACRVCIYLHKGECGHSHGPLNPRGDYCGGQVLTSKAKMEPVQAQERKPLSDERIYELAGVTDRDEMMHRMARNIARAIEQAHGIKEQP